MNVAVTFDVESDFALGKTFNNIKDSLPLAIDVLKKEKIKSTFFVTGKAMEKFGDKIKEICKGHEIASHGYTHTRFDKLKTEKIKNNIEKTKRVFWDSGLDPIGFRAPKLCLNKRVVKVISKYYEYDSSVSPSFLPFRYFNFFEKRVPHNRSDIVEIPIGTINIIRLPMTSSWMFLFEKNYFNFLNTFGLPETSVFMFHSFDFVNYSMPENFPSYKYKLYYSKCGHDKIQFLKKLIEFLKSRKSKFKTCEEIFKDYS